MNYSDVNNIILQNDYKNRDKALAELLKEKYSDILKNEDAEIKVIRSRNNLYEIYYYIPIIKEVDDKTVTFYYTDLYLEFKSNDLKNLEIKNCKLIRTNNRNSCENTIEFPTYSNYTNKKLISIGKHFLKKYIK